MRDESVYLQDIVDAADEVFEFLAGLDYDAFVANRVIRKAVIFNLVIVGEAAGRLSDAVRERHPEIDWPGIISFRNYVVHEYFGIRWRDVWESASHELPTLGQQIAHILKEEFPEPEE